MRTEGFMVGAVGGLAIALLLVGLVAAFPQANPTIASQASVAPVLSNSQSAAVAGAPVFAVAGAASGPSTTAKANGATAQRPDSLLAVLPGESSASLLGTVSPLLLGLVVAALVYAAYSRRQDASS
jgi:hypothetical protein